METTTENLLSPISFQVDKSPNLQRAQWQIHRLGVHNGNPFNMKEGKRKLYFWKKGRDKSDIRILKSKVQSLKKEKKILKKM